jgi:hypothetical protein
VEYSGGQFRSRSAITFTLLYERWMWASISPGITVRPPTSTACVSVADGASAADSGPACTMVSPSISTSPARAGAPVPSMRWAFLIHVLMPGFPLRCGNALYLILRSSQATTSVRGRAFFIQALMLGIPRRCGNALYLILRSSQATTSVRGRAFFIQALMLGTPWR